MTDALMWVWEAVFVLLGVAILTSLVACVVVIWEYIVYIIKEG